MQTTNNIHRVMEWCEVRWIHNTQVLVLRESQECYKNSQLLSTCITKCMHILIMQMLQLFSQTVLLYLGYCYRYARSLSVYWSWPWAQQKWLNCCLEGVTHVSPMNHILDKCTYSHNLANTTKQLMLGGDASCSNLLFFHLTANSHIMLITNYNKSSPKSFGKSSIATLMTENGLTYCMCYYLCNAHCRQVQSLTFTLHSRTYDNGIYRTSIKLHDKNTPYSNLANIYSNKKAHS